MYWEKWSQSKKRMWVGELLLDAKIWSKVDQIWTYLFWFLFLLNMNQKGWGLGRRVLIIKELF